MLRTSVLFAAVLTAFSTNLAAQEVLNVGAYGGSTETLFKEKIIPNFEKEHNVKVMYVAGNSTDTLAKLVAQKNRPEFDVALLDDGPLAQANQFGLCSNIEPSPVYDDLYPLAKISDTSMAIGVVATGLFYNTEAFAQAGLPAPTSWEDLTKTEFKDKVVIPPISNGYGLQTLIKFAKLRGGGESNIDPGFEAIIDQVGPNVLAWEPSPGKMTELFQNGDAILGVWGSGRVEALKETGFPVEFVYPQEGTMVLLTGVCPVAGRAENNPVAQAFIQYLVSPEIQALLADGQAWGPVNSKTELTPEVAAKVPYGEEQIAALETVDWTIINKERAQWTNRWNRTVER